MRRGGRQGVRETTRRTAIAPTVGIEGTESGRRRCDGRRGGNRCGWCLDTAQPHDLIAILLDTGDLQTLIRQALIPSMLLHIELQLDRGGQSIEQQLP